MSVPAAANTATQESQAGAAERRAKGEFVRGVSAFRSHIGTDADFPAEPNRYHLFVAFNCPWCHRVALAREVLGLADSVTLDVCFPNRTGDDDPAGAGFWEFNPSRVATLTGTTLPECTLETATGQQFRLAKEIYEAEGSTEKSVPILYDKQSKRIVSNESAEIIRMLSDNAAALGSKSVVDLRPTAMVSQLDAVNELVYGAINNGAYKAGFSSAQPIYAAAFTSYFSAFDVLERLLRDGRNFLCGAAVTEADVRLYPTLFRHDPVYFTRMKLNAATLVGDYPLLWRWLCRMYALPGVAASCPLLHCRQGYFGRSWNNVVPLGPLKPLPYPEAYGHPELAKAAGGAAFTILADDAAMETFLKESYNIQSLAALGA
jgi:putative glutathione S-transferase